MTISTNERYKQLIMSIRYMSNLYNVRKFLLMSVFGDIRILYYLTSASTIKHYHNFLSIVTLF